MIRILVALMLLMSCAYTADARREQALQAILQDLTSVKQEHLAHANKIGDKALAEQIAKRHDALASEWQGALKTGTLAPGSKLAKWRDDLQQSLTSMQAKKKEKAATALQDKLDYVAWLLGKADPRFDGGRDVILY